MKAVKVNKKRLAESMDQRDKLVKELVIAMLIDEGYGTYAKRLQEFDFLVTDFHYGNYISVAAMFPKTGEICINPSFLVDAPDGRIFKQLSVVVRHELLHFLLMHERRFYDHLKAIDPEFEKSYRDPTINELANFAMDWDLSREGYDDHDKEVVRTMTLNGKVIGGLILDKPMEEIFDLVRKEHEEHLRNNPPKSGKQPKTKIKVTKATHTQEYTDAYNKTIQKYQDENDYSDGDIADLLGRLANGEDIDLDQEATI